MAKSHGPGEQTDNSLLYFQNHKIMHQEIMLHQQLVESVCDKAQQLVDQTQDKSLNIYLQSIKQLFQSIVTKSQVCDCVIDYVGMNPLG
jgi:uncharacterized protein YutE (UPF0331/DUF86 family)